jgi:signal transduction histidine kinase/CheY-like chemotaxis protein
MSKLGSHFSEDARLEALEQTGLLDTGDENVFDEQIRLLANVFERPIAALSLVDRDRIYLKSRTGVEARELVLNGSFCGTVVSERKTLVVEDALSDSRFNQSGLVKDGGIRFYVGEPIEVYPGCCIGSLCVLDTEPGEATPLMMEAIKSMSAQVGHLIALRRELMLKDRIQTETLLAAGTLHEVKNSLTPAITYMELLVDQGTQGRSLKNREEWIRRASFALNEAVETLRSVRFDGPDVAMTRNGASSQLSDVITPILRQTSHAATDAGVTFRRSDRSGDGAQTKVASAELRQIVSNLVLNALDAMRGTGGLLDIATHLEGGTVTLEVSDEGTGMSEEERARCFEPLYSTKRTGEGSFGGSGIGLTLVRQIVRDLGGTITLDSEVGRGTTFRVELPLCEPTEVEATDYGDTRNPDSLRILVVDDEPSVLRSAGEVLTSLGHEPTTFEDPTAALRRFRRVPDKYDVALIDLGMRPMDGLQLARHLRDVRGDLPIIIVSGRSLEGRQLPHDAVCLEKPYRINSLNDALDQIFVRT